MSLRSWFEKAFAQEHVKQARPERREVPGLEAIHWTGSSPGLDIVKNISSTGMYLVTRERILSSSNFKSIDWKFCRSKHQSRESSLFEHDLRAKATRLSPGKAASHFSASCSNVSASILSSGFPLLRSLWRSCGFRRLLDLPPRPDYLA